MFQADHHSPCAQENKCNLPNYYRPVALTSVAMKCFERLVMAHISTIIPETLDPHQSLCNWILDFQTGRPQVIRVGNNTSAMLILNTRAPQGCVLSPLLYSLFTHDCTARHNSNTIIKFAVDT